MRPPRSPTRRQLLRAGCAGASIGLAGCLGDETETDDTTENADTSFPEHDGQAPVSVPDGRRCDGICGMESAAFPEWNAQLAHADGTGAFFCSPGGLLAYVFATDHVGGNDTPLERLWVRDFERKSLIDGETAIYVIENDEDEQQRGEPMGVNPRPFEEEADAMAYVEERDWLADGAVRSFDGIDYEIAYLYNAGRIPSP